MFHLYLTLAYIIPNIYVFFRIMKLFIIKRYRLLYILIYILIATVYPFSEIILRGNTNAVFSFLSIVAGYILPFYFYLLPWLGPARQPEPKGLGGPLAGVVDADPGRRQYVRIPDSFSAIFQPEPFA